jgi:peptide/nickel transport system substrate-binding protein
MTSRSLSRCARVFAVLSVAAALAFGSSSAGASTHGAKIKKGGTLTFLFNVDPPGMDPIQLREVPQISPVFAAVMAFDELVYTDPVTLKVKPKMATSLTTNDKGLTWVMKLHSGIRFSDGTTLDAAAVQFNWQRVADPANKVAFAAPAQEISTYETPDPLTLKVTLKAADPIWDQQLARNLVTIGSPTALKANAAAFDRKPVGAGPFLLKEWIPAVSQSWVRNPDYWQKGKPYIDDIEMKNINDDSARLNTFLSGSAQMNLEGTPANLDA